MTARIRRISVHVDEPEPGLFFWVLMEEADDASRWLEIESEAQGYDAWLAALQAGTRALIEYAFDERIGPRELREDEDAAPTGLP